MEHCDILLSYTVEIDFIAVLLRETHLVIRESDGVEVALSVDGHEHATVERPSMSDDAV